MQILTERFSETRAALTNAKLLAVSFPALARMLGYPPGAAGMLSDVMHGRVNHVSDDALEDLRRRLYLSYEVRHIVTIPGDHDATVHVTPGGNGALHTYHVPADAEVVIVPAGAHIVQPKPPSGKPARRRWRLDLTEYAGRISADEVRELVSVWIACNEDGEP